MRSFARILFVVILCEMFLGGGGRFTAYGPVSLRMILFLLAVGTSVVIWSKDEKIPLRYVYMLAAYSILLVIALTLGILNNAPRAFWWEDIKPLSYFYILPFFYYAVKDLTATNDIKRIVKISSLVQACVFFVVLILIHSGAVPFLKFYYAVLPSDELHFRGETTFFYKGFLFLCIGVIFFYFGSGRLRGIALTVLSLAIFLSFTRGFVFALFLTAMTYTVVNKKWTYSMIYLLLAVIFIAFSNQAIGKLSALFDETKQAVNHISSRAGESKILPTVPPNIKLLGDRDYSDARRFQQIKEVANEITPLSFFFGHGFGIGIPTRPVHMEISYLEIFHKQGIIGLAFWGTVFAWLTWSYLKSDKSSDANAFFCSGVFVFCQSLTNQYVNNPIGMSVVILSLLMLDRKKSSGFSQANLPSFL